MGKEKRASTVPFYAVAALWLGYAVSFPLYEREHYLILASVSAVVFLILQMLCSVKAVGGVETATSTAASDTAQESSTGNAELDQVQLDMNLAINEMKRLDAAIQDAGISADIVRLEGASQAILRAVQKDPDKLPQIRRFMDYYLPTTLKLLNSYDRMSATGVSGENIDATLSKVEGIMRTIVAAFEKQLDSLYGSEALDISSDISVLETMMASEGLTGDRMQAEEKAADPTDIRLEL